MSQALPAAEAAFDLRNPEAVVGRLERMLAGVPGWSMLDQLYSLFLLAYASSDVEGDIVEIGAYCGRSSLALGLAAQLSGAGRVHAVDLFPTRDDWHENEDGTFSLRVRSGGATVVAYKEQRVWREPFYESILPTFANHHSILERFTETIARNGLAGVVLPLQGTSALLPGRLGAAGRVRLAFIDGDHDFDAVCQDIESVMPYLSPGGWICFDDAFSVYEGVDRAIRERIIANPEMEAGVQLTRKLFVARKRRGRTGA
jgi:predicted O-methyltransferase YrrM